MRGHQALWALFYRIGPTAVFSQPRLERLITNAAVTHPDLFAHYQPHPIYNDSEALAQTILCFTAGGALVSIGHNHQLRTSKNLDYGASHYASLTPDQRMAIDCIARELQAA